MDKTQYASGVNAYVTDYIKVGDAKAVAILVVIVALASVLGNVGSLVFTATLQSTPLLVVAVALALAVAVPTTLAGYVDSASISFRDRFDQLRIWGGWTSLRAA